MFDRDPYAELQSLKQVPAFKVTSTAFQHGGEIPPPYRGAGAGGSDVSPQLAWTELPDGAESIAITCYDPDAPTASGFWHWAVINLPAGTVEIAENAGAPGAPLPDGAVTLPNEARLPQYIGPNPPPGSGVHRYFFAVLALDTMLELDPQSTPAVFGFNAYFHTVARGVLMGTVPPPR